MINIVCLVGRLFRNPELRTTQSGRNCVMFDIALDNGKDENGEKRRPDDPTVYVYDKQAENMAKYCNKGSLIGVIGKLKTSRWDKEDGSKGYATFVVANRIIFLDTRTSNNEMPIPEPDYTTGQQSGQETTNNGQEDAFAEFGQEVALSDEDLPF